MSELFLFKIAVTLFMLFVWAIGWVAMTDTIESDKLFKISIIFFYVISGALGLTLTIMVMEAIWTL